MKTEEEIRKIREDIKKEFSHFADQMLSMARVCLNEQIKLLNEILGDKE